MSASSRAYLLLRCALIGSAVLLAAACKDGTGSDPNPLPVLSSADPGTLPVGEDGAKLTLEGSSFRKGSRVRWNEADRPTEYVSATRLTVQLSAQDIASAGSGKLTVFNPAPGGGSSGTLSVEIRHGVPVVTSLTPSRAVAQSDSVQVVVNGSGFGTTSMIRWNGFAVQTRYISRTQLATTIPSFRLTSGGVVKVSVFNPSPGGGLSASLDFSIENPVPTVTSLSPDSAVSGGGAFTLTARGSGFVQGAVLRWNGADRATTFVNSGQLTAQVSGADVASSGFVQVTVANPAPGGGASAPVSFRVREAPPRITGLSPSSVAPGAGPFTLTVTGANFSTASTVRWNGAARPTTFVNAGTVTAAIGAADVATAGSAQVTVHNPEPSGSSSSFSFPVLPASHQIHSVSTVTLRSNHVVYDPVRRRIYASVPSSVAGRGNTVTSVDPQTGAIVASVFVGSEPGRMAISDDASYLYVVLNGAPAVARVSLANFAKDLEIQLGNGSLGTLYGEDIEVLPGSPRTFVVSRRNSCCSPRHEGVAIFDDASMRPKTTQGHTGSNRIVVGSSPGRLYGYNNETTEFGFRRIAVRADGLQEEGTVRELFSGFSADIEYDSGRVYATSGAVVDAESMSRVGTFAGNGLVRPDARNGRVHFFSGTTLTTYHSSAFTALGSHAIPAASGAGTLIRWGSDGIALRTAEQIVLVRSTLVGS